jgi:hypothetical protein
MERYPDSVFAGAFVLYVVAIKMIVAEPLVNEYVDPMHDLGEFALPWVGGLVLTGKQYYRTRLARARSAE